MRRFRNARALPLGAAAGLTLLTACARHPPPQPDSTPTAPEAAVDAAVTHDALADAPLDATASLAADVDARVRAAHARFGDAARVRTLGGIFVLVEAGHPSPLFDQAAALVARALPALFDGRFTRRPESGVTVFFFPTAKTYADYYRERQLDAGADLGVYRPFSREIAVDVSRGADYLPTFTHEIVHPLMDADFPRAPLWLSEGIAALYEAPVFGTDGSIHGRARNWRHGQLQAALANPKERTMTRLDALFGMSARTFRGLSRDTAGQSSYDVEGRNYALARSVCAWLDEQGKLWPFYHAWRDGFADDPSGERAFARVVGSTPKAADAAWARWAR